MEIALHQLAAMAYVYRRMIHIWLVFPLVALSFSLLSGIVLTTLDYLAAGNGVICLALTVAGTLASYRLIYQLTKHSKKAILHNALARNRIRLPVFVFLASCILSRYVIDPLLVLMLGLHNENLLVSLSQWTPSFYTCSRFAVAMALLGISVIFRYVGRASVMRCSIVPLLSNPLGSKMRYFLQNPLSMLRPGDNAGELLSFPPFSSSPRSVMNGPANNDISIIHRNAYGRRYQKPTFRVSCAQLVFAILIGAAVAHSSVASCFEKEAYTHVLATCVLATVAPVFLWVLGSANNSHEVDPRRYLYPFSNKDKWMASFWASFKQMAFIATCMPFLSHFIAFVVEDGVQNDVRNWNTSARLAAFSCLIGAYLYLFDEILKTYIARTEKVRIKGIVDELHVDSTYVSALKVILGSLLLDSTVTQAVLQSVVEQNVSGSIRQSFGMRSMDREELEHSEKLMQQMARVLLSSENHPVLGFEEDALRLVILESFGGISNGSSIQDVVSKRHQQTVQDWIDVQQERGEYLHQKVSISLVRGFAVFVGGYGEALCLCSSPLHSRQVCPVVNARVPPINAYDSWALSPTAFLSIDYAIRGLRRFVVRSLSPSGKILSDWRSSHLASMIPASITSLFHLHVGLQRYLTKISTGQSAAMFNKVALKNYETELLKLLRVCYDAAGSILRSLHSLGSAGRLELKEDTLRWVNEVIAKERVSVRGRD